MNKMFEKLIEIAIAVGVLAYLAWAYFIPTVAITLVAGLGLTLFFGYNILSNGGLMERSKDSHGRRDRKGLSGGFMGLAAGFLLLATGRNELGHIGAALIVLVLLIGIFVIVLSPGKGKSS